MLLVYEVRCASPPLDYANHCTGSQLNGGIHLYIRCYMYLSFGPKLFESKSNPHPSQLHFFLQ